MPCPGCRQGRGGIEKTDGFGCPAILVDQSGLARLCAFAFVLGLRPRIRSPDGPGKRVSIAVPVICVGNFTVGGAGKTPTAIALARAAVAKGLKPGFLSRVMAVRLM